jgi:hypothetical protein
VDGGYCAFGLPRGDVWMLEKQQQPVKIFVVVVTAVKA